MRRLGPFTPIDIATLLYLGAATIAVLVTYRGEVPGGGWLFVAHALVFVVVLLAPRARAAGPVGRFLGEWYPMALLAALYGEIGVLTVGAGLQNDWWIQRLEMWVFGSEVSYNWIREMPNVAFSWVLHLCYLAYYPILYASPLGLWLIGRREAARDTIFAVMVTFYLCYLAFLFFPATNVAPARWAQWVLDRGDSWGAAFPSSHVAASVVAVGMALRYYRPLGLVLLPLTIGLLLSVVYGQFHYGVDALSGLVLGGAMLATMRWVKAPAPEPAVVGVLEASR